MSLKRTIIKPYDKDKFELVEDYEFTLPSFKAIIPRGFISDGASIPRIFWSLYPPYKSEYFTACIIHDFYCQKARNRQDYKNADKALKEAMEDLQIDKTTITIFYNACYVFHTCKCLIKMIRDKLDF